METEAKNEEEVRLGKLKELRERGIDPYPSSSERTNTIQDALNKFEEYEKDEKSITLTGRILSIRRHGGSSFANLKDESGKIQIYIKKDEVGEDEYDIFSNLIDIGDIFQATGKLFTTKRGERSLLVSRHKLLAKSLIPLPDKWHGLKDIEERFRKRYLDLLMNQGTKERFIIRSKIITVLRKYLDSRGFLEVETPTLQPIYGGGYARPFITHHNKLDTDLYLCISDEMYLKRLIVGGFEKVYEIYKVFRNEGIDSHHNPEFTMWEAQIAYQDYYYGMDLIEEIFEEVALSVYGKTEVNFGEHVIDLKRPWKRVKMVDAIKEVTGIDVMSWSTIDEAKSAADRLDIKKSKKEDIKKFQKIGEVIAFVFEEMVEHTLIQPTIVYDYPVEVSPLAKKCEDPMFTQRFEFFVYGSELGNNYTELNDPIDLEKRFIDEKDKEKAGFEEAQQTDYDYLDAIRQGFPPTCGVAIGIDRMVMLFTNAPSIKEVILFPTLRGRVKT